MECAPHTLETLEFDKIRAHIAKRTVSTLGREEVETLAPSHDPETIEHHLRPVLETVDLIAFDDPLSIGRIPDIRPALRACTVAGSTLMVAELLEVGDVLRSSRFFLTYISTRQEKYPRLWDLIAGLSAHPDLESALNRALDPEAGTVKDSASPELRRIRRNIEQTRSSIRKQVESVLNKLPDDMVQDRLVTLRAGRFVIPIRENRKRRIEGIVHDQSASGATLFIEPMVTVELNNRLRQLELAEQQEIKRILLELTGAVAEVSDHLLDNLKILGKFDAVFAKASFARDLDATEPLLNGEGRVVLRQARHPLLVYRLRSEGRLQDLVSLDLTMGTDQFCTLVLTGPNAGGKTVALKTVGLLALMAQAGLPIPARPKSELPIFSGIFADIGDAQSIENDLSTFSSHMANLAKICEKADSRSLVLLDEIGSSTDPDQGSALAMALLEELTGRGSRTIATTHHGALKAFAHSTEGMANGSMAFDAATLRPTFRFRLKVPGSSYAFEIARRLEMPARIVDAAVRIAGSDVGRVESLIAELDETCQHYQEERVRTEADRKEAERLKADYETRLKEVERRERELKRTARQEAQRILEGANALVERTVQEIRQRDADRDAIRQAHARIRTARQELNQALKEPPSPHPLSPLKPGDRVWLRSFEKEGVVVESRDRAGRVVVEVGKIKVEVSPADLEARAQAPEEASRTPSAGFPGRESISPEVDLRGLTSEEAVEVVDKYLDDLYLNRMERATLIHGKGTGALRRTVGGFLKQHPRVKTQRPGNWNEGGSGVTIVALDLEK